MDILIVVLIFVGALLLCLIRDISLTWVLAVTFAALFCFGLHRKKTVKELWVMVRGELPGVWIVVRILCYVGLITGLWRSSGTIGIFIWYGMKLVPPRLFLLLAFLLAALLSYAIGTSFGVTSTAGIMLIALARAGGVSVPVAAGAILSGVYFGDRGAPTSSCATLQAALTKTDHYTNVRHMLKTGALPLALTLVIYTYLSFRNPMTVVDTQLLTALEESFNLSWLLFVPAAIMLVLPAVKVPLRICMGLSALAAFLLTVLIQGVPVPSAVAIAFAGYAPGGVLESVLSGGGFFSMVGTMLLLLFAGGCTGIIGGMELLKPAKDFIQRIGGRIGRFPTMILASVVSCMIFCNQTIAMIFCKELMEDVYTPEEHQEFSADMSCSVVVLAGLVPWCIACSVPLSMLGAGFDALPYACYLYLIPICYFLTKRLFFPVTEKERKTGRNQREERPHL